MEEKERGRELERVSMTDRGKWEKDREK